SQGNVPGGAKKWPRLTHSGPECLVEHVQKVLRGLARTSAAPVGRPVSQSPLVDREAAHAPLTPPRRVLRFPVRTVVWIKQRGMVTQAPHDLVKGRTRYPPEAGGYSMA